MKVPFDFLNVYTTAKYLYNDMTLMLWSEDILFKDKNLNVNVGIYMKLYCKVSITIGRFGLIVLGVIDLTLLE